MLSGYYRRLIILPFSFLIASSVNGQAGKAYKYYFNEDLKKAKIIENNQSFVINYSISELNIEDFINSSGEFFRISIPGHNPSTDSGKPELPVLSRLISIPPDNEVVIRITEVKSHKINPSDNNFKGVLYPSQPGAIKNKQSKKNEFLFDKSEYSRRGFILSDTVKVEKLGKLRNRQLGTVLIYPVRYNPSSNQIDIITSMRIEIEFPSSKGFTSSPLSKSSALFNQSLENSLLNYNYSDLVNGYTDKPVRMVIITDPAFKKNIQPFLKWKTQQGFKLTTIYKATGLSTYTQLKDSVSKIYHSATPSNPAPDYLLIIGDVNRIPKCDVTSNISDMYYGEFDGNGDYIPDLYIGRLPVADTNELKTVLGKIIQYEKFQFADTNKFYRRALVSAGNDGGYASYMNGQVKYLVSNYLNSANKIDVFNFYYSQASASLDSIKKLIKKGLTFINYTGHGDASGWLDPALRSSDIPLIANKDMYPFVISNACRTAQYNTTGSFGNTMLITPEKGAVGYIGCSNDSYWDEDFYWAVGVGTPNSDPKYSTTGLGAIDRLFHTHGEPASEWYYSMGQINYAGNLSVSESTSTRKKYYWETYTLLGDPSAIPYMGQPETFNVTIPDTLPNGITSLSLTIPPFSYIAISHGDTLWDASFASTSGSVVLDMPGRSNDSCLVVITGQNKIPLIKTVRFATVRKEFLNLTSASINDFPGNKNGMADYGESLYLKLIVDNLGQEGLTGLYAKLTASSGLVSVDNDSVSLGGLSGRSQVILPTCFKLNISSLIPDKAFITLNLKLGDSKTFTNYTIDVCLHAPVLDFVNCLINDSLTGNGNNIAEPGEQFKLAFKINNSGSSNISGALNVLNQPDLVIIPNPSMETGSIQYNQFTTVEIPAQLSGLSPHGGSFDISTSLSCAPYTINRSFTIPIGRTRESFEYQKMTVFPWIKSPTYPWITTNGQAFDGQYSARSGIIPNSSESLLKLYVNVPVKDTVRFYLKVSSEASYDFLLFRLNGNQMLKISGETTWTMYKFALKEGFNLLEWDYKKDESMTAGSDCAWIDNLMFPLTAFNNTDLKTGKIVTPQPGKSYAQEPITAEIINLGIDTVKSFNLAYRINSGSVFVQNFVKKINPSDTVVVAFSQPANFNGNGTFLIKVYGLNNNDYYLLNDTSKLLIVNTGIFDHNINPDNNIKIMPNPFRQSFKLEIESPVSDQVTISIIGTSGEVVWEEKNQIMPGTNYFNINPEHLTSGLYSIKIKGKTTFRITRIIKIN